jgi:hypothetical protein
LEIGVNVGERSAHRCTVDQPPIASEGRHHARINEALALIAVVVFSAAVARGAFAATNEQRCNRALAKSVSRLVSDRLSNLS